MTEPPWETEGDVAIQGGSLHWAALGSGPPLVLMPKVGGWIADWRHVAVLLGDRFRVIAIDLPGHGKSAMAGPPPFIIPLEQTAAAVVLLLDELGIETAAAAGNSLGGLVLLAAARCFPGRISRLGLVSSSLLGRTSARDLRSDVTRKDIYDTAFSYDEVNAMFALSRPCYADFVGSQHAAGLWKAPSIRGVAWSGPLEMLAPAAIPLLLMYGEYGTMYARHAPAALARRPDLRIETVKDCGSFVHQERPEECAALLADFLA